MKWRDYSVLKNEVAQILAPQPAHYSSGFSMSQAHIVLMPFLSPNWAGNLKLWFQMTLLK